MSDLHVVVIGAGIGGLALAQGLRRAGLTVSVHERDAALDARAQGYRLHLDTPARDALLRLLPPPAAELVLATAGRPLPRFLALDRQLRTRHEQRLPGSAHLAVDRLLLRRLLYAGLEDVVHFDRRLVDHDLASGGRPVARFADGTEVTGDVLVAADGVGSAVRARYLPHARVVDTGVRQLYGTVALTGRTRALFDDDRFRGVQTTIGEAGDGLVGVAPVRAAERPPAAAARLAPGTSLPDVPDYATCSFAARREWFGAAEPRLATRRGAELHAIVTRAVRTWHPRVRAIVAACDPASLFAVPLRQSVPVPPWPTTRVTLLGDAIHAMSPAAGAGACTALVDADRLATALRGAAADGDLLGALGGYEADLVDRGFAAVRAGAANGRRFLGQDPLPEPAARP